MRMTRPSRRGLGLAAGLLTALSLCPSWQDPARGQPQDPAEQAESTGPTVGKPAPTARLNDHQGHATVIGGKRDTWTVLAFYPKAATPG